MVRSSLSDVTILDCTLPQLVFENWENIRDKQALVDGITGQSYTYAQLRRHIVHVTSGLVRLGVEKGDMVAIMSPNNPDYAVIFFAVQEAGATVTTINPDYTPNEVQKQLEDSGAKFIYTTKEYLHVVKQAVQQLKTNHVKKLISLGGGTGCVPFSTLLEDDGGAYPESLEVDVDEDIAVIPYSSGTTGLPKGVMLTHKNIVANLLQSSHEGLRKSTLKMTSSDDQETILGLLPFFHAYGLIIALCGGLRKGFKIVTLPKFVPETFLQTIQTHKITAIAVVPPILIFLINSPLVAKYDLSSLKFVGCGAAPLAPEVITAFGKLLPHTKLSQGYGLTETSPAILSPTAAGSAGTAGGNIIPNTEVMIVDVTSGRELGAGEKGEIWVRGPQVMKGYFNNPKATAETIDKDGWLHTGDVGYYDTSGNYYIVDRIKELIKVKGFQVAPAELEALLLTHPRVADVGVIGITDRRDGEVPKAFIVLKPNSTTTGDELKQFVKENATSYKQLRGGVEFLPEIPKSPSGKILRRKLREMAEQNNMKSKL